MKKKFYKGEKVSFVHEGTPYRGVVAGVSGKKRSIATDTGKKLAIFVELLKKAKDSVLILESRLDRSLRSERIYGEMMAQALHAYNIDVIYERVHTRYGFTRFLKEEINRNKSLRIIHIMSHGRINLKKKTTKLHFTFESLDLDRDAHVFKDLLEGKILIFSSCEVGNNTELLKKILKISKAQAIFAYRVEVEDWYTNIVEFLLYDRIFNTIWSPGKIAERVTSALKTAGIQPEAASSIKRPVLVCVTKNGVYPRR
ncbi:MAG: hypothetical protein HZA77_13880 [Candidatus Schekmanbacteria bacterium]|nr:hypothetical protein [Candidatus Schekmanbacteria bacterium]